MLRPCVVLLALAFSFLLSCSDPPPQECTLFDDVTIIDGTGAPPRAHATLLVRGNFIESITDSTAPLPECTKKFDGKGKYLIPGLWDMHVHGSLYGEGGLGLSVRSGVTTVLDLGGNLQEIDKWIEEVNKEARIGPRIFRAGPVIQGPGSESRPGSARVRLTVEGMEDAQGAVRTLKQAGVNVISVHQEVSSESFKALALESRIQGLPFIVSLPKTISAVEAIRAGTNCLVQTETLFDTEEDSIDKELVAQMVAKDTWLIPALISYRRRIVEMQKDRDQFEKQRKIHSQLIAFVGEMHKAGVKILAGTDYGWESLRIRPGYDLHNELYLLVRAGLTPMQAIQSATVLPARFLKVTDAGTIERGKRADLVLLGGNPLEDISNVRKVLAVTQYGRLYAGKRR